VSGFFKIKNYCSLSYTDEKGFYFKKRSLFPLFYRVSLIKQPFSYKNKEKTEEKYIVSEELDKNRNEHGRYTFYKPTFCFIHWPDCRIFVSTIYLI